MDADCLLWSLTVDKPMRKRGLGKPLVEDAMAEAKLRGCKTMALEWTLKESPHWVFDWYTRLGFEEVEFGKDNALMVIEL